MVGSRYDSPVVDLVVRFMLPFIHLFAAYVIMHGHYSPGGGFQGGAVLAATILLMRFVLGWERSEPMMPRKATIIWGGAGVLIFAGVGVACVASGGNFLDYGSLPISAVPPNYLRSYAILVVEIGVALGVTGILVSIFDDLTRGEA